MQRVEVDIAMNSENRIIKKYPNRRLYDTTESKYVTLNDLKELVVKEVHFTVVDKKTGDDITRNVLLQIIIEQEEDNGEPLFSAEVLQKLIGIYGNPTQSAAGEFLNKSIELFCDQQKVFQNQVEEVLNSSPMSSLLAQMTKKNMEIWREMQESFVSAQNAKQENDEKDSE